MGSNTLTRARGGAGLPSPIDNAAKQLGQGGGEGLTGSKGGKLSLGLY